VRWTMSVTVRRLPHGVMAVLVGVSLAFLISGSPARADTFIGEGLYAPEAVAVDGSGDVFIADTGNDRVVVDKPNGTGGYIQSVVTTDLSSPLGVAVDGSGDVFIADTLNNRVLVEKPNGSGGYTRSVVDRTGLLRPWGVAVDGSGDVFIADAGNHRVLVDKPNGSHGYTGAYNQSVVATGLSSPLGVAVDGSGDVYITDNDSQRVLLDKPNGIGGYTQSVINDTGLTSPFGVAVDGSGDVYIGDFDRVLVDTPNGTGGYAQSVVLTGLNFATGVAVDGSGNVFVGEVNRARVVEHAAARASLTYPTVGQTNVNTATPFSWGDVPGGQGYQLWIGTSRGDGRLLKTAQLPANTSTYQVPTLPTGVTLWARLYTQAGGDWGNYRDIPFTVTASPDVFTYPTAGQQNINTLTPLSWGAMTGAQAYHVTIGKKPGTSELANSGILSPNTTSYREPALPAGQTLYARLAWEINGSWSDYQDVSFTAGPNPVVFTDPTQGQTGVSSPTTFTWSTSPAATGYQLWVGTTRGSGSLLKSGLLNVSTSSVRLPALPAGQTLWARIYTGVASGWGNWQDISFTTAPATSSTASMTLIRRRTIINQLTTHAADRPTPAWMQRLLRLEPDLHQSSHARPR
jgi:NHL repeat